MFIADNWKDYEVIDTSCKEKTGALGRLSSDPSGSAGDLGYAEEALWLEETQRAIITGARKGGGRMGVSSDCPSSGVSDTGFRPEKS